MRQPVLRLFLAVSLLVSLTARAMAAPPNSGSDGLSGVLNPASSVEIDLSLATTGDLADAGRTNGTYDPVRWAVIFKYASVNIPNNVIVTFKNHPSGAPVVWLVQGNVTIGTGASVSLNGEDSNANNQISKGGPGGFGGGKGDPSNSNGAGTGPGGGDRGEGGNYGRGGSYATSAVSVTGRTYGSVGIVPLIGGSGGGSYPGHQSGGGGGGAILVAANGTVSLNGVQSIRALGGNIAANNACGSGSGGAIRILADAVSGSGFLVVNPGYTFNYGQTGGSGRVRIEANTISLPDGGYSAVFPLTGSELIFPDITAPTVRVSMVNGQPISATPNGEVSAVVDANLSSSTPVTVNLVSSAVPTNSTVTLRVVPRSGNAVTYTATSTGSDAWQVTGVTLPQSGVAQLQALAVLP